MTTMVMKINTVIHACQKHSKFKSKFENTLVILPRTQSLHSMYSAQVFDFFCNNQFGFRPGHSCEIALLCMTDDWAAEVDKGNLCGLGFVDMV